MNTFNLITTAQAAELLGISPRRIQILCKARNLGTKPGHDILLSPSEVNQLKVRVSGRPRALSKLERLDSIFAERERIARDKYADNPEQLKSRLKSLALHKERLINGLV